MRVPDTLLQNNFMRNVNKNKSRLAEIQLQITTQSMVNKPSDNPLSNARILRIQDQMSNINTYKSNITYGLSIIDDSILSMDNMQTTVQDTVAELTKLNSAIVDGQLDSFASGIESTLQILVDLANSSFNGQYNFGGTENTTKPFTYDKENNKVITNSDHIGGEKVVRIASSITQRFNITGKELFQSVLDQKGNLDSTAVVGSDQTTSGKIYDAEGNEYTLDLTYTKTADNTYDLNYSVIDSDSNTVTSSSVSNITFNASTGKFESIDGDTFGEIKIKDSDNNIDTVFDLNSLRESDSSTSLNTTLNQKVSIFDVLTSIKQQLSEGKKPSEKQMQLVADFNQHLLDKLSEAGGISKKLNSTQDVLQNRETELTDLLSKEKDVDVAKSLLDLENAQYALNAGYKISSMIIPSSLLDYL